MPSEHDGMVELHKAAPSLVPEPIACGKCKDITPTTHFLVLTFKQFVTGLPDPFKLGEQVAAMHKNGESSRGLFGFPVQTFDGARTHNVNWDASWTSFFSKLLAEAYRQSCETSGVWPELDQLYQRVQSHLIPRLIGALESEGRTVKPTIIHGNMWEGNIGTDSDGNPWIYDCSAYYGHNEMELGIWRAERHKLHAKVYAREYRRHYDPSEPEEEADDRVRLYSAKTNFMHSACYAGSPAREWYVSPRGTSRELDNVLKLNYSSCFNDFTYLLKKYVDEDEEEEESDEDDEEIAQASVDFKKGDIAPSSVHVEDQALPVQVS